MTLDEAKEAINKFFSDTGNSRAETRDGLEELREEINMLLDALDDDDLRDERGG